MWGEYMSKKLIRVIAFVLILSTVLSANAFAETRASKYISTYNGYCYWADSSTIQVYFDISAKRYIDQLGATYIWLYESSDLNSWSLVKTFYYGSYSNMMAYNDYTIGSHVDYSNAVSGRYYKATISFIAADGGNSESRTYYTPYI
jgi:hypothetical protein